MGKGKEGADGLPVVAGCGEDSLGGDRGVVASSNSVLHVLDQHVVLDQLLEPAWPLRQQCMGVAGDPAETLLVEDDLRMQRHEEQQEPHAAWAGRTNKLLEVLGAVLLQDEQIAGSRQPIGLDGERSNDVTNTIGGSDPLPVIKPLSKVPGVVGSSIQGPLSCLGGYLALQWRWRCAGQEIVAGHVGEAADQGVTRTPQRQVRPKPLGRADFVAEVNEGGDKLKQAWSGRGVVDGGVERWQELLQPLGKGTESLLWRPQIKKGFVVV
jgi:hypothetical protein